jgi:hypothetical protein
MKLRIILTNGHACELDTKLITVKNDDEDGIGSAVAKLLAHTWVLYPGDTIRIVEEG